MSQKAVAALQSEMKVMRGELNRMERLLHGAAKPVFVTLEMAERLYGFDATTLRHWANTGQLDGIAIKIHGRWLVKVKEYENWILSQEGVRKSGPEHQSLPVERRSIRRLPPGRS